MSWSAGQKPGWPPAPGSPKAGILKWQKSTGLLWAPLERTDLLLSVTGRVLCYEGMLVLLPNLGPSWSYKLRCSLHPVTGLPCPRVIRDHPDCTSVAAYN